MYFNINIKSMALISFYVYKLEKKKLCVCNLIKIVVGTRDAVDNMAVG